MLQRAQNQPKNLAQLKRALTAGAVYRVIKHYIKAEYTGQMRVIQQAGSTVFYSGLYGESDSDFSNLNYGKGIRSEFNTAKDWNFSEIITMTYHGKQIMEIEIMEEVAEAPTEPETVEAVQDTTCTDKAPQEDTERATAPIITEGARLYCHPLRAMVTVYRIEEYFTEHDGSISAKVIALYRNNLYIVASFNLYADKTETTPAILPPQSAESREEIKPQENTTTPETDAQSAAESHETTADDTTPTARNTEPCGAAQSHETATGRKSITTPTEGTQEAPQSRRTTKGIQRHHRPPKTAYRAIQRAGSRYHAPRAGP